MSSIDLIQSTLFAHPESVQLLKNFVEAAILQKHSDADAEKALEILTAVVTSREFAAQFKGVLEKHFTGDQIREIFEINNSPLMQKYSSIVGEYLTPAYAMVVKLAFELV